MATFEEKQAILAPLVKAVQELLANEKAAKLNPGEPVVTSHLFRLLHDLYPGYSVDHLYDRRENIQKRLKYLKGGAVKDAVIIPDIVVHEPGEKKNNLLVVEVKRYPNKDKDGDDAWKLEGMTAEGDYHYNLGVHLTVRMPTQSIPHCEVYSEGRMDAQATEWLKKQLP